MVICTISPFKCIIRKSFTICWGFSDHKSVDIFYRSLKILRRETFRDKNLVEINLQQRYQIKDQQTFSRVARDFVRFVRNKTKSRRQKKTRVFVVIQ